MKLIQRHSHITKTGDVINVPTDGKKTWNQASGRFLSGREVVPGKKGRQDGKEVCAAWHETRTTPFKWCSLPLFAGLPYKTMAKETDVVGACKAGPANVRKTHNSHGQHHPHGSNPNNTVSVVGKARLPKPQKLWGHDHRGLGHGNCGCCFRRLHVGDCCRRLRRRAAASNA